MFAVKGFLLGEKSGPEIGTLYYIVANGVGDLKICPANLPSKDDRQLSQ